MRRRRRRTRSGSVDSDGGDDAVGSGEGSPLTPDGEDGSGGEPGETEDINGDGDAGPRVLGAGLDVDLDDGDEVSWGPVASR